MLNVNETISIRLTEFDFTFSRSPGPGGQNVNKVNSKVTLRWNIKKTKSLPAGVRQRFVEKYARRINNDQQLILTSHRYRDQGRNIADCLNKLRLLILDVAKAPVKRKPTRPTAGSKRRRLDSKKRNAQRKESRKSPPRDD